MFSQSQMGREAYMRLIVQKVAKGMSDNIDYVNLGDLHAARRIYQ
jgi:hypothetical protein